MANSAYEMFNLPNMGKIYGNPICYVYIADGFQDDCEALIHKCIIKHDILEYHMFCRIWKEMNMGCLYQGRTSAAEIAELSEEVLHIAKRYMVGDTTIFEMAGCLLDGIGRIAQRMLMKIGITESVAGLFLVYSLMHLQPYQNFASLRLVPEDVPAIQRIESIARREKRYDVLYILGAVLIKGPCQFHAAERERGMEPAIKKYLDGFKSIDSVRGVCPRGVFYRQNEELDLIRELGVITAKYSASKAKLFAPGEVDQSLQYIDENLSDELCSSLKNLLSGYQGDDDIGEDNVNIGRNHLNAVEEIKTKAMKEAVNPVKHLTGIADRELLNKAKQNGDEKEIKKRRPSPDGNQKKKLKMNEMDKVKSEDEAEIELHISYTDSDGHESSEDESLDNQDDKKSTIKSLPMLLNENVGEYEIEIIDAGKSNVTESVLPCSDGNTTVPLTNVKREKITKKPLKRSHLRSRLRRLGMLKIANLDK